MASKIPVGDTLSFAYSNTFGNILQLLGLTWLPLAIAAGISYYAQVVWYNWMSQFPMFMSGHPDPQAMMAAMSSMTGYAGIGFLATLVSLFMSSIVGVAVTQQALGTRTGQTFVHLAAGSPEWRVFGGYIRLFFAILGIVFLAVVAGMICAYIGYAIGGQESSIGGLITAILAIAIFCLTILTLVRMSFLMVPSIVIEPGKGGLARSYHLTRGNFWRIFVVVLVLVIPVLLVSGAIQSAVIGNSFMGPLMHMMQQAQTGQPATPEQMQQMFAEMMASFRSNFLPMAIIGFIGSFFISALTLSGAAFSYRSLSGSAPDAVPAPAPAPTVA